MPSEDESEDEPPEKDVVDARMKDFDRFFGSVAIIPRIEPPKKSEPQQFSSVWKDGIFSSNYFRFSFKPPK
jgi:hypothetical protein